MITSIQIKQLRGVREGLVSDLGPLTILTGVNGCGKSTVLEALLIATSPRPEEAVGRAVARHTLAPAGAVWLAPGGDTHDWRAALAVTADDGTRFLRWLRLLDPATLYTQPAAARGVPPPYHRVVCWEQAGYEGDGGLPSLAEAPAGEAPPAGTTHLGGDGSYSAERGPGRDAAPPVTSVRLIDPRQPKSLVDRYSEAKRAGHGDALKQLLRAVGIDDLEILADPGGKSTSLYATRAGQVIPVALIGDGLHTLIQVAVEVAAARRGLVLLEEPEVFQHPGSLRQTARALVAACERDIQIVLTTHSHDLIDAILREASGERAGLLVQLTLSLRQGKLEASRLAGADLAAARWQREEDLR